MGAVCDACAVQHVQCMCVVYAARACASAVDMPRSRLVGFAPVERTESELDLSRTRELSVGPPTTGRVHSVPTTATAIPSQRCTVGQPGRKPRLSGDELWTTRRPKLTEASGRCALALRGQGGRGWELFLSATGGLDT